MSTNETLPTYEEATKVTTEFAGIVENFLKEKGLGENYAICVIQTMRNAGNEDTDGEEGTMSSTTFLWDGEKAPDDSVFIRTAMQLQKFSRKLMTKSIWSIPDILRKLAEKMEWKECDCPGCKAEREEKKEGSPE